MSYETQHLSNLEGLQADFDTAVNAGDKKLAFKILSHMTEIGLTVEAQDMFSDVLMRMRTNHESLLGGSDTPQISQEDMNGGFTNLMQKEND